MINVKDIFFTETDPDRLQAYINFFLMSDIKDVETGKSVLMHLCQFTDNVQIIYHWCKKLEKYENFTEKDNVGHDLKWYIEQNNNKEIQAEIKLFLKMDTKAKIKSEKETVDDDLDWITEPRIGKDYSKWGFSFDVNDFLKIVKPELDGEELRDLRNGLIGRLLLGKPLLGDSCYFNKDNVVTSKMLAKNRFVLNLVKVYYLLGATRVGSDLPYDDTLFGLWAQKGGRFHVIEKITDPIVQYDKSRFFCDDILYMTNNNKESFVVCTQWELNTIFKEFIMWAKEHGFKIYSTHEKHNK